MSTPKDILAVARPKNSVVYVYGKNKDKYGVKARVGCKRVNGKNRPINGPTIGHIVDGVFVAINPEDTVTKSSTKLKDWGNYVLCDNLFKDIIKELTEVYNPKDAMKIYCITMLRVCSKGIKDYELKAKYEQSFLSELYPDVALSKNTVSTFMKDLGRTYDRIVRFMQNRAGKVNIDHHVLIDGTLKTNESKVNSLSNFSRKAKKKGSKDISIIYAFDLEAMEPICSKCFPGNMLDVTAYKGFVKENRLKQGIIVADKGFPFNAAKEHFESNTNLHYLNPVKRNSKFNKTHDMLTFDGILNGYEGITYKKAKCGKGSNKWLYSFRDAIKASYEEKGYLEKASKDNNYDHDDFILKQKKFGTILLESDLDLDPKVVYQTYNKRWEIELVMRYYKHACDFDETRVHNDYSVLGSEFCDFLATVLTYRLINYFDTVELLEKYTYKILMRVLDRAKKFKYENRAWELIDMNPSQIEILEKLGLVETTDGTPKRKRGRPRKKVI